MQYCGSDKRKNSYIFDSKTWKSIIFQIIFALYIMQKYYNLSHNDLHLGNILFKKTGIEHYYYRYKDTYFKVPLFGYSVKIIDWNRSTFTINNSIFYNDCFREDGVATGQFTLPMRKYKPAKIHLPNDSTDLAILSKSIL